MIANGKVWAICEVNHGVDGRGKPDHIIKRIYDTEGEAKDHVFAPFVVREVEIDVNDILDDLAKRVNAKTAYVLRTYKGDAIVDHLLGKSRIGGRPAKPDKTVYRGLEDESYSKDTR